MSVNSPGLSRVLKLLPTRGHSALIVKILYSRRIRNLKSHLAERERLQDADPRRRQMCRRWPLQKMREGELHGEGRGAKRGFKGVLLGNQLAEHGGQIGVFGVGERLLRLNLLILQSAVDVLQGLTIGTDDPA